MIFVLIIFSKNKILYTNITKFLFLCRKLNFNMYVGESNINGVSMKDNSKIKELNYKNAG